MNSIEPFGPPPRKFSLARLGIYAVLGLAAFLFLIPLWVTVVTSLKPMSEIRLGHILAWPSHFTLMP